MYTPFEAARIASAIGERLPLPAWLADPSITFDQWCASVPMQAGPLGPDGVRVPEPIPAAELPAVWRAWQHRRADILAHHWVAIGLFEVLQPALNAARRAFSAIE